MNIKQIAGVPELGTASKADDLEFACYSARATVVVEERAGEEILGCLLRA